MKEYNGHRSWNAWNVSLWISNDEGLYNLAKDCRKRNKTRGRAASEMLSYLPACTPDGARYNYTCVFEALSGIN